MKKLLLLTLLLISIITTNAQDYCLYDAQKGFNFGSNYNDKPHEILEQPDGRFIVIGTGYTNVTNSFHIVGMRIFPNGNLDPSFGNQGKIDNVFNQRNTAICADLQTDGKVLTGGYQAPSNGVSGFRPYVARFNANGSVDTEFGDMGSVLVPYGSTAPGEVAAVKALSGESIQVVTNHQTNNGFSASRLLLNGDPDSTYNENGYMSLGILNGGNGFESPSSIILEDGSFFWVGRFIEGSISYNCIAKVNADGSVVSEFGENGVKIITEIQSFSTYERRCEMAFDGHILISSVNQDNSPYIVKVNSMDGSMVSSFGTDGITMAPIAASGMDAYDIVRDDTNQEFVLLYDGFSSDVGTMRIDNDGNIIADCGALFNIPSIQGVGSQSYNCGLFDEQGYLRILGWSGATDENSIYPTQNFNFMWPYSGPFVFEPIIFSVSPSQLQVGSPVEVNVFGHGFNNAQGVSLASGSEVLNHISFDIINDEELKVLFYPEETPLGMMDVLVYLPSDTLILAEGAHIIDNELIDGDVNVLTRARILVGAQTLFSGYYRNLGTKSMLAAPVIITNTSPYSMDFENQPMYDFQDDDGTLDLINYLVSQGIDESILNNVEYEKEGNLNYAFLTSKLSPQAAQSISAMSTIDDLGFAPQTVYLHPNPIVGSAGILESYLPEPGHCTQEIVLSALLTAIPGVDLISYESCFNLSYMQLQTDLAAIVRSIDDERVIPMKGAMMKLLYDLMSCVDDTYLISESEFEMFNAEMASLFATNIVLNDDFPCDSYVEASTYYQGESEMSDDKPQNPAYDKTDPWGLGINFNSCTGCMTYNLSHGVASMDPNEKIGPTSLLGGIYLNDPSMYYAIHFENVESADIAAKTVLIVDTLDIAKVDVATFKFTNVSWGDQVVTLNEAASSTEIDLRPEVPNILRITTELDEVSGITTWLFETLDTLSMMPTENVDHGFLPPNLTAPEGMGFVGFEVELLEDIESGSTIENNAQIYFDFNDPITTNTWVNVFDDEIPESHVNDITDYVAGDNVVNITWETEEPDPAILYYNIYYNTDGSSDWEPWLAQTTETASEFTGELGMTYYFMSVAVDSAFNVEEYADSYDAFIFMNPVGIDEINDDHLFSLYPNPANKSVVISITNQQVDNVVITDMTGRVVLSQKIDRSNGQNMLQLDEMANGIYNVSVRDGEGRIVGQKKLMVFQE